MSWYFNVFKLYATFSGRARRKEYWYFMLFNFIFQVTILLIDLALETPGLLFTIYNLAIIVPILSVTVRRLHDTGRSGWWIFIGLIPLVGGIIFFVFTLLDSDQGENLYGQNPKELETIR